MSQSTPQVEKHISQEQAVEKVKNLPEVQDFLKKTPSGKILFDSTDFSIGINFLVRVFNSSSGVTFNFYYVNAGTGNIIDEMAWEKLTGKIPGTYYVGDSFVPKEVIKY